MNTVKEPIRYYKAAVEDAQKVNLFLQKARTAQLGLYDGEFPYVIPMAYVWHNGVFYFHGSDAGKKNRVMADHPKACFSIDEEYGSTIAAVPASLSVAYFSVVAYGQISLVEDIDEATEALQVMMDKYVPGYFDKALSKEHVRTYTSSLNSKTATFKFTPESITAKESEGDIFKKFFGGRHRNDDTQKSKDQVNIPGLHI